MRLRLKVFILMFDSTSFYQDAHHQELRAFLRCFGKLNTHTHPKFYGFGGLLSMKQLPARIRNACKRKMSMFDPFSLDNGGKMTKAQRDNDVWVINIVRNLIKRLRGYYEATAKGKTFPKSLFRRLWSSLHHLTRTASQYIMKRKMDDFLDVTYHYIQDRREYCWVIDHPSIRAVSMTRVANCYREQAEGLEGDKLQKHWSTARKHLAPVRKLIKDVPSHLLTTLKPKSNKRHLHFLQVMLNFNELYPEFNQHDPDHADTYYDIIRREYYPMTDEADCARIEAIRQHYANKGIIIYEQGN